MWVYDGNVRYIEGKHIALFLVGLLAFVLLFVPYTLLLVTVQWVEAGSNHWLLSWANNLKVRSFADAYHAPYKNKHRYWVGLLLVLRFVLFVISAIVDINSPRDPSVSLLVLSTACAGLTILTWNVGSMYKKWCNNVLESSFILNLTILAAASYQVKVEGGNQAAVVYTSVSIAFVTFLGIITYHLIEYVTSLSLHWTCSMGVEHWQYVQEVVQQYFRVFLHHQPDYPCCSLLASEVGRREPGSCCLHFSEHCFCDFPGNHHVPSHCYTPSNKENNECCNVIMSSIRGKV